MRNDDPAHVVVRNEQTEQATKPLPTCERCGREMPNNKICQVSIYNMYRVTAHGRKVCDECANELLRWIDTGWRGFQAVQGKKR